MILSHHNRSIPESNLRTAFLVRKDLQKIENEAFANNACEGVIIPDGCVSIGSGAFRDCKKLIYVKIPASVEEIADDAFEGCGNIWFDRQ